MHLFNLILIVHIFTGFICLITGLIAGFSKKKKGKHTLTGQIYFWSYSLVFLSAVIMAITHWQESAYLFYIALFSFAFALLGYVSVKKKRKNWLSQHIAGMLGSYIGIVTATLVVNSPKIPLLNEVPILAIWLLPTIIGTPIIFKIGNKYAPKQKKIAS
ncbi:DUF2306 domain-containing protein [Pseudobacillus wudalianchiensis]|uniref:DUF2306 domain-containing protein n=1 Tax=Pseudobacillus wudalianchiensis TaxID=1743143 RepID=UPI0008087E79|nr:DUF2306 domain-containing protein [Bacillus wudalianchiensis]